MLVLMGFSQKFDVKWIDGFFTENGSYKLIAHGHHPRGYESAWSSFHFGLFKLYYDYKVKHIDWTQMSNHN